MSEMFQMQRLIDLEGYCRRRHDRQNEADGFKEARAEIERLRAALKSCNCPGGGWNGMPKGMEATVENCMTHDACGCSLGAALRGYEQKAPESLLEKVEEASRRPVSDNPQ